MAQKTPVEQANGAATQPPADAPPATQPMPSEGDTATVEAADINPDLIDDLFKDLKTLLSTVEKLQKARQEVGDIKPLVLRLLDGELLAGDELEQLKSGVNGLSKLVRLYSDYQSALDQAQPVRDLLDQVIKA